jgi:hypothetical protein
MAWGCPKRRAKRALFAIDGVKYAASPLPVGVNKIKNVLLGQPHAVFGEE